MISLLRLILGSLAIATLAQPFAVAQAQPPEPADALQAVTLCGQPGRDQIQVLVTAADTTAFSRLFSQIQQRWPQATLCLDAPTAVSDGGLWIRVAEMPDRDRAQSLAQEIRTLSGYPAILRAFSAEG